jgi:hypothetical protein
MALASAQKKDNADQPRRIDKYRPTLPIGVATMDGCAMRGLARW